MHKSNRKKLRAIVYLSVITASFAASFVIFITYVRPVYVAKLKLYAEKKAVNMINTSLESVFTEFSNDYSECIYLEKKSDGTVSALKTDTLKINKIRTKIAIAMDNRIKDIGAEYIGIPLGSLFANELLTNIGPDIKIKVRPESVAKIDFHNSFDACGINQTRHTIYLLADIDVQIITNATKTMQTVSAKIPVSETIIVGETPKYYGINTPLIASAE